MSNPPKITPEQAQERLKRLCARQEKCSYDLMQKLKLWGILPKDAERIVAKLIAEGYVNDSRFAALYAKEKSQINRWGPVKIKTMLLSKGISKHIVDEVLSEVDAGNFTGNLALLLKRKLPQVKAKSNFELRAKLIRFGVSRGFELAEVIEEVSRLVSDTDQ